MVKSGNEVTGVVKGIQPYGVILQLPFNEKGLIHISECKSGYVGDLNDLFKVGQEITALVIDIDEYTGQISLSTRALEEPVHTAKKPAKHYWTNRKLHFGFKPLSEDINGFVHEALKKYKNA